MRFSNIFLTIIVGFSVVAPSLSDEFDENDNIDFLVEKKFVIVKSAGEYAVALEAAKQASEAMEIKLDLRGLSENKDIGLTSSKEFCESEEGGFAPGWPCYYPRGRWDDGTYVSIEYSSFFKNFRDGYYIVIVASYSKDDESGELAAALEKAKKAFPDAYAKTDKVYMGCMH